MVPREMAGVPLDRFLENSLPEIDRRSLRRLVREGQVTVDGIPMTTARPLHKNAVVMIARGASAASYEEADRSPIEVLHDDDEIVAISKPAGMAADPEALDAFCATWRRQFQAPPAREILRAVDKTERDASGIVVFAKTLEVARRMREMWLSGAIEVEDLLVVDGEPEEDAYTIDLPLGADRRHTGKRVVDRESGDAAQTEFRVLRRFMGFSLLSASPRTRRTHQVRAHAEASGFPLTVDPVYGVRSQLLLSDLKHGFQEKPGRTEKPMMERITLHRRKLWIPPAPGSEKPGRELSSAAPPDFERLLRDLEHYRGIRREEGAA
ncbi:MAG: RluA family pseudouridine synthase [Planctomycetes bacterium]|nr:RluA family pseudouridine synthase [Planctomycetota bacterium]